MPPRPLLPPFGAALVALVVALTAGPAAAKTNINAASAAELKQIPGFDPQIAVRIVARRVSKGPFRSLDELLEIPGITKLTLVRALGELEVGPMPPPPEPTPVRKIDLNRATFPELLLLPEMTPRAAKAIVDYRDRKNGFRSIDELDEVPGLDKRLLVKLVDQVTVPAAPKTARIVPLEPTPDLLPPKVAPTPERAPARPNPDPERVVARVEPAPARTVPRTEPATDRVAARVEPKVRSGAKADAAAAASSPAAGAAVGRRPAATLAPPDAPTTAPRININAATLEELLSLPRMTRVAAEEILQYRQKNGPFREPHAIVEVPSIGEATFARIRDRITTE